MFLALYFRRVGRISGVALAAFWLGLCAAAGQDNERTWALLKKPGHMAILRHSHSPESPPDGDVKFNDCKTQRNLDDDGRAQARRLGNAFRKHGISSARLYSSQYCRAMETAKLTKLGSVRPLPALNQVYLTDLGGMGKTAADTRKFMKSVGSGQITILVSHVTNIQAVAGASLSSGEIAVVHIDPSGNVAVDGRIMIP
jgi:phosphohistidine phosphatase SixA